MTTTPVHLETPEDLQRLMGTDYAPSPQQWAAITAPLAPAVVVAGAGSGKTTLMAARVVYLVATGLLRPDEVLGLTFTTKAATELRRGIIAALEKAGLLERRAGAALADDEVDVLEPTVATYNAYAATLLTDHGLRIGHEPDTRVVTDAARYQLGARVVERHTGQVEHLTDHPPTAIQNLLALDGAMSEHLVPPERVRAFDAEAREGFVRAIEVERAGKDRKTYREAAEKAVFAIDRRAELLDLVEGYRALKADLSLMDFSDQIELAARLVSDQPEVGVLERARFKVVLLDEYQDTSVAQAVLLSRLFSGPDAASGRGHAVTAVGDPNQAIYGWRGASVSNILNFAETFPAAVGSVPTFPLTVNRRSDARILEVANRLAEPLYARYDQVARLEAKPGAEPGVVTTAVLETQADELARLVAGVQAAHAETGSWADIGVLTRDNAHAESVFDALTEAQVPVEIVGLSGLLRLPEVAEVVAILHLLHDPTANTHLLTLLTGPRWAIGPRDLRLLAGRARELAGGTGTRVPPSTRSGQGASVRDHLVAIADGIDPAEIPALGDALDAPGHAAYSDAARERFALLSAELRVLRTHVGEPLLDVVRRIIDTTGVDIELASAVSPAAAARRDNLDLFVKAVADFQAVDGDVSLAALLAYLTAEDDQGNGLDIATPTAADSVKLLTVHRSKGLEWASVFLVGVCETRFPSNRSRTLWTSSPAVIPAPLRGDAGDLPQLAGWDKAALEAYRAATRAHDAEEELRLGYVAITRAAHRLSVTSFCWSERPTPFGPSDYQRVGARPARGVGRAGRGVAGEAGQGRPQPLRRRRPVAAVAGDRARRRGASPARRGSCRHRRRPDRARPRPRHGRGRPGRRLGRRARPAAHRGQARGRRLGRGRVAVQPVGHRAEPASRRPRCLRPRAGPSHAPTAGAERPGRHPVPRVGRGALRSAHAARCRRRPRPGRGRRRDRRRPRRAGDGLRGRPLRRARTARGRGAVRARPRRAGGAGSHRRCLHRPRGRLPPGRLEDPPRADRRSAPACDLPRGLGRAQRRRARSGARRVLLRPRG